MDDKLSGSYYTPVETIDFMCKYLLSEGKNYKNIIEPSVGDGRFLDAFLNIGIGEKIVGVELYKEKINSLSAKNYSSKVSLVHSDFLLFSKNTEESYNLVIGNPPYINIKNMDKDILDIGKAFCDDYSLPTSLLQNTWVAFVLASLGILDENGAIFFVLPTEFLQVQYAEKLRVFLEERFNTIHIISFAERMFPNIEQEACLVYLTNEKNALPYILYRHYENLNSVSSAFESKIERNKPLKKWSNAILSDYSIDLLNCAAEKYASIGELSRSAPGIVTASNNKFILTQEEVAEYDCANHVIPIVSKGVMARNKFEINNSLIEHLANEGKKVFLLNLAKLIPSELPDSLVNYLNEVAQIKRNGIEIQNSFKCSRRKPWYGVPIVKSGKVVFFKRYDLCPRISTNPNEIHTTDIAYNLQLNNDIDAEDLVFCFYNSLTLAKCEFAGRYYAGGVCELTPTEFRSVCVPYRSIAKDDINTLKEMFDKNESLKTITSFVNSKTIAMELTPEEIEHIDIIHSRLIQRRKQL